MQDRKKDTDVYNGLLDSEGEGEGGMIWENGILTCTLSCKNRIASLCPMQDTACLGLVHRDDQGDVMRREVGGGFMFGNACTPVVDSCQCMAKPILKKKSLTTMFNISMFSFLLVITLHNEQSISPYPWTICF